MFKKRTLAEERERLEVELLREGVARDYDDLRNHLSDNAYLYYLNHKIGWTNKLLGEIRNSLYILVLMVGAMAGKYFGVW